MNNDWKDKKRSLQDKQEALALSTKKLKRTRITGQGRMETTYEPWPADGKVLQRIANAMPFNPKGIQTTTAGMVLRKLHAGDKLTTRYGGVYSLVPINERA